MERLTRRSFLRSCLHLAGSAAAFPLLPLSTSCKEQSGPADSRLGRETEDSPERGTAARAAHPEFEPAFLALHQTGELSQRAEKLWGLMASCELCPRMCGTDRLASDTGFCGASAKLEIAAHHPHFGEEKGLVGTGGSGAVFFTNCGLRCVFCINWQISQGGAGSERSIEDLAGMMLTLQKIGCGNINVVTPTHYSAHIVRAVDLAAGMGLRLPIVYNTCGWERPEILRLLDGIVDIYLPDFKYADGGMAEKYSSGADTYPQLTKAALIEMHRQVGTARPSADGLIRRGLIVRHLVMPNNIAGTRAVMKWIGENLPADTYVNVMSQYTPVYKASEYPPISRRITRGEYDDAVRWAREAGLTNLDIQGYRFL